MAVAKKPAVAPDIDDAREYDVTLKGVALLGRLRLLPRDTHVVTGAGLRTLLRDYPAAVEAYTPRGEVVVIAPAEREG